MSQSQEVPQVLNCIFPSNAQHQHWKATTLYMYNLFLFVLYVGGDEDEFIHNTLGVLHNLLAYDPIVQVVLGGRSKGSNLNLNNTQKILCFGHHIHFEVYNIIFHVGRHDQKAFLRLKTSPTNLHDHVYENVYAPKSSINLCAILLKHLYPLRLRGSLSRHLVAYVLMLLCNIARNS